jgi:hypothetical protein
MTSAPPSPAPEQLRLLDASGVPLQFRLDASARRRGLAHVAEIRRQLAEQAVRRGTAEPQRHRPSRPAPQKAA